jgi:protein MpaA
MRLSRSFWPAGLILAGLLSVGWAGRPPASLSAPDDAAVPDDPFVVAELEAPRPRAVQSTPTKSSVARWEWRHRSTQGRPIESVTLGEGSRRVAILSSLHGNETQSQSLVTELAKDFVRSPDLIAGQTVLIIRSPNPDGLKTGTAFNARGVDLNRNFPSNNWKALPRNRAGARVGSEVETRALVQLLEEFKPDLLIHVKDTKDDSLINGEGDSRIQAESIARDHHWRDAHDLGQVTSGSLEHFAHTRLKCECLTVLAKRQTTPREAWEKHKPVLLATLGDELIVAPSTALTTRRRDAESTSSQRQDDDEAVFTPRQTRVIGEGQIPEKGYVELPPSPGP